MVCVLLVVTLAGAKESLRINRKTEEQILQEETSLWGRLLQDASMRTAPTARAATKGGSEDGGGDAYGVPKRGRKHKKRQRLLNVN